MLFKRFFFLLCVQDGFTAAYIASASGNIEVLALLLANKADVNAATRVID
jgi:ankyrin repeat protein